MKIRWPLVTLAALVCAVGTAPLAAKEPGYNISFAGRVVAVDLQHGTLRIARGPTETAGPAIEECTVPAADLKRIRVGMNIEAMADTRKRPWRLIKLRIFQVKAARSMPDGVSQRVAQRGQLRRILEAGDTSTRRSSGR